ncbi:MAG TPA: outer membrane lipoprotein-sorting protein, partial [Verrucomicrobiae bacterium]
LVPTKAHFVWGQAVPTPARHPVALYPLRSRHILITPLVSALILFLAFAAGAQSTNSLPPAEIQGQQLAAEILSETPATNLTQTGLLRIRNSEGTTNIPITFKTDNLDTSNFGSNLPTVWRTAYSATPSKNPSASQTLIITHIEGQRNGYSLLPHIQGTTGFSQVLPYLTESQIMSPFAGSDFWIADLGLEFFHWPEQKIIGHETRRTRNCTKLESDNPDPSAGGYSRVVTWIDNQTLGIIYAEAYDTNDKLLKIFDPKKVKKVNGQWQLEDIEIQNVQTHSRTWIRFDLK